MFHKLVVTILLGILLSIGQADVTMAGGKCDVALCAGGKPAPSVTFKGSLVLEHPIKVRVCHGYWDRLAGPRWWNPTIRYGKWERDLPAVHSGCKDYWVRPGTDMRLYASCVGDVIGTGQMLRSGTYVMK